MRLRVELIVWNAETLSVMQSGKWLRECRVSYLLHTFVCSGMCLFSLFLNMMENIYNWIIIFEATHYNHWALKTINSYFKDAKRVNWLICLDIYFFLITLGIFRDVPFFFSNVKWNKCFYAAKKTYIFNRFVFFTKKPYVYLIRIVPIVDDTKILIVSLYFEVDSLFYRNLFKVVIKVIYLKISALLFAFSCLHLMIFQ